MMDDHQLLAQYVRESSEEAFTELVRRHTPLVYSAALRQVRDPQLARDVAQVVFANLARKARSVRENMVLAGWLHRDTRFTALDFLRAEHRREKREQHAALMNEPDAQSSTGWEEIRPLLDEALHELSQADRDALLLRFFEQRNLPDVGASLGASAEAARKRVDRALDRLRTLLAKRGITTTAGALAIALSANAVEPVPAGLVVALAASSAPVLATTSLSAASSWTAKLLLMSKPKLVLVSVAAVAAISTPVLLQERAIAAARAEQRGLLASGLTTVEPEPLGHPTEDVGSIPSQKEELERLRKQALALHARADELRAQSQALAPAGSRKSRATPALASFSFSDAHDAGQNTPADFLQTYLWACSHGDTNRIMQLMTFEPATDMDKVRRAMEDIRKEMESGSGALLAQSPGEIRLVEEQPANNNDRWITIGIEMKDGREDLSRTLLRHTPMGWAVVVQTNGVPVSSHVEQADNDQR